MFTPKFAARRRGFTLIELLIVIVVIAILALIVIPKLMGASRRAKDATLRANLHVIRNGLAQYEADLGEYPGATASANPSVTAANLNWLWDKSQITDASKRAMWRGPYGTASSGSISAAIPLPKNPYVESSAIGDHWTYSLTGLGSSAVATVKPNEAKMGYGDDADSNDYQSY